MNILNNILNCWCKEFKFYFQSKMIYLLLLIYLALSAVAILMFTVFFQGADADFRQFFNFQPEMLSVIIPAITMHLWVDEKENETWEVLVGKGVSSFETTMGKFLAAWSVVGIMLIGAFGLWFMTLFFTELNNLQIFINFILTWFFSAVIVSVCLICASICRDKLGAYILSYAMCFVCITGVNLVSVYAVKNVNVLYSRYITAFDYAGLYDNMIMGQICLSELIYFVISVATAIWIATEMVDYKRG